MKVLKQLFGRFSRTKVKKVAATAAVFVLVSGATAVGVSAVSGKSTDAAVSACGANSTNSIIRNGASSRKAFIADVKKSSELQAFYKNFGLSPNDYNRFVSDAKPGVAYDNNTIVVDGNVVANSVGSTGRLQGCQGSNPRVFHIAGKNFYGNMNSKAFASGTHAIPVDVLFDGKGKIQFAVMTGTCGNATYQHPVAPTMECKELHANSLGHNQWSFTTSASAGHGATIQKLVYNFGDGSKEVTTKSPSDVVKHTFTKSSRVTVTVYVKVPGGNVVKLTNGGCAKRITFTPPKATYACDLLNVTPGKADDQGNVSYTLNAEASAKNATIKSYTFYFGDHSATKTVNTNKGSTSVSHTYAPGSYTAHVSVTVHTDAGKTDTVTSADCHKPINVKQPAKPVLACTDLTLTKGDVDKTTGNTTYTLKATGSAKNATITGYTFSFGDQTSDKTVKSSATSTSVTHTYAPGDYTAKVTVTGKDNNGKPLTATSANCQKSVSVPKPNSNLTCDELKLTPGTVASDGSQAFVLTARASAKNATITGYTFSFGDQSNDQTVTTSATTATTNHTYAPGTYTAKVTVTGKDNSGKAITATSANCQQPVNVSPKQNPNITITKHVDGQKTEQVDVNQQFVYQLVITNNGQQTLTNAVVTDPAPNGVTMLSADLGTVDTTKNSWSYTIPSLAVGESVNVNITAVVKQYMAGNIVNTACVNALEVNPEQPNQPDSCDTATVTVTPPAAPQQLVNTGAGSVATIFAAAAIVGTALHRYFLTRRLSE